MTVMDAPWLEVVRERSQFLFLQLWSIRDWDVNAQPFISLGFTAIAVPDERIRKLCAAAALVGAAGLAVAFIGGLIGPVAILVQGQAWRWVWITVFIGAALVPFTALQVWRDEKCGPLCALLLVSGWTLPGIDGTACVGAGSDCLVGPGAYQRSSGYLFSMAVRGAWRRHRGVDSDQMLGHRVACDSPSGGTPGGADAGHVRAENPGRAARHPDLVGNQTQPETWVPVFLSAMLAALSIFIFPAAFKQSRTLASAADIHEFADWTNVIPPTSTVLVAPPQDVGAFVWFTLGRPNYLAVDQSAGAVFSRATALEVRRRSEVLLPLMDPDWKILTSLRAKSGGAHKDKAVTRPLTREDLSPDLRGSAAGIRHFARQSMDSIPCVTNSAGAWKDWNLYDCRKVRSTSSAT